jgi:hypothetical protein
LKQRHCSIAGAEQQTLAGLEKNPGEIQKTHGNGKTEFYREKLSFF